jgi:hypothetical protein
MAHGAVGCAAPPSDEQAAAQSDGDRSSHASKDGEVKIGKDQSALDMWDMSGGASGDMDCSMYDRDFSATATEVEDDEQSAYEAAFEAAKDEASDRCEGSAGYICRTARAENPTATTINCFHRGKGVYMPWYCTVTVDVECHYSVF